MRRSLSQSELFRLITENAEDMIAVVDMAGNRLYNSPAYQRVLGYTAEELQSTSSFEQIHPDDRPKILQAAREAKQTGRGKRLEYRMRHKDGGWRYLESTASAVRNAKGEIVKLVIVNRDVTERKLTQIALQESEERQARLLQTIPMTLYSMKVPRKNGMLWISENVERVTGYGAAQFMNHADFWLSKLHPDDLESVVMSDLELYTRGHVQREYRWLCADETYHWFLDQSAVLREANGAPKQINGSWLDVTERKMAAEALGKAHEETGRLFSSISSILIGLDEKGVVTRWNASAEETFGVTAAEIVDRGLRDARIDWLDGDVWERIQRARRAGGPNRIEELRFRDGHGRVRSLALTVHPVCADAEQQAGYLVLCSEITEQRLLEDQLRQAQKLEAIGQLAAGVAHEINTPTQYVGDNIHFLRESWGGLGPLLEQTRKLGSVAPTEEAFSNWREEMQRLVAAADLDYLCAEIPNAIQQSTEGVKRVAEIIRAMRDFSHPGKLQKVPENLNDAIQTTITVAQNEWKYVADMVTDLDSALPLVPCLAADFKQAMLNLILNASQAIGELPGAGGQNKGRISIRSRRDDVWAEIRVEDTGPGIPKEIRSKIFDPFFTTKDPGKGTGQGLAIVHAAIVKKHQGKVWFETEIGKGTTFIVQLPLEDPQSNA
ncbi:MAG: PAS domain S-box protein [Candidatus Acidiferrales bacterium]